MTNIEPKTYWQKCSSCKKEIPFNTKYFICSVSTCQSVKLGLHFCSVSCWDAHLGFARHRDAGALDAVSPTREAFLEDTAPPSHSSTTAREPVRKIISPATSLNTPSRSSIKLDTETLVVVSKVKQLIRDQSEMNTSQCAIDALTQKVVQECLKAIENAKSAGRKTVMGRDVDT